MFKRIKALVWNIISSSLPIDYELEVLRKILLINILGALGCCFIATLTVIAFYQEDYLLALINILITALLAGLIIYLRKTQDYDLVSIAGNLLIGLFYIFIFAYGGVSKTAYIWSFTYPLISLYLLGTRFGTLMSFILLGLICVIFATGSSVSFIASYDINLKMRFIPTYLIIYLFSIVVEKVRKIIQNRLTASNIDLEKANREKDNLIKELQEKVAEIQTLQGILPMCARCKKIRDDQGYWEQVEKYVQDRSEAQFTHGICPDCAEKLYPDHS